MSPVYTPAAPVKQGIVLPADQGFIAWAMDGAQATASSSAISSGTLQTSRLEIPAATSITNIWLAVGVAGSVLTASQNLAAIYQGGTLIGQTADQATNWQSIGVKQMALVSGPFAVAAGDLIVAWFSLGTTRPAFRCGAVTAVDTGNAATPVGNPRFGTANTGLTTTFPGTIGTITAFGASYWSAVN